MKYTLLTCLRRDLSSSIAPTDRMSGVQKTLLKLKKNVANGDFYEAFQQYHSLSQRYIKQKKYKDAIALLHDGTINMLTHEQHGSAVDLLERLLAVYTTNLGGWNEKEAKGWSCT